MDIKDKRFLLNKVLSGNKRSGSITARLDEQTAEVLMKVQEYLNTEPETRQTFFNLSDAIIFSIHCTLAQINKRQIRK